MCVLLTPIEESFLNYNYQVILIKGLFGTDIVKAWDSRISVPSVSYETSCKTTVL